MNTIPKRSTPDGTTDGRQSTSPASAADAQRDALLESERRAHAQQPRNFKDDALTGKVVSVEPDGTGPTPTDSLDAAADKALGSGNRS